MSGKENNIKTLKINYSLNDEYFVDCNIFYKILDKVESNVKLTKIIDKKIIFSENKNNLKIELKIKIKKDNSIKKCIMELENEIKKYIFNLLNSKPENIFFSIEGEF